MDQLNMMKEISFNKNPSPRHKEDSSLAKIPSVHCTGLLAHYRDFKKELEQIQFPTNFTQWFCCTCCKRTVTFTFGDQHAAVFMQK